MKILKLLVPVVVLLLLVCAGFGFWLRASLYAPHSHEKSNEYIQITKGSTPGQILDKLVAEGILESSLAPSIYLHTFGDSSKLKAGEYQFASPISPIQVLTELEKGAMRTTRITIPEGFTRFDIAKRIAEKFPQNPPMDDKAILYFMDDVSLIREIDPQAKNLEGYMFPNTYDLPEAATAQQVIKTLVDQFKKTWKPDWTERAKALGRTPREIVTIASLIETESKFDEERPIVASVIYNRLQKNIPLGIDQTAVYIAKMENRWDGTINKSDLESQSPYNTRKFVGLPPGPISSVSESSLNAALNPEQTNFFFYVLNVEKNDGSHNFYSSAAEFEKGKAAYQSWLDEQRKKKNAERSN